MTDPEDRWRLVRVATELPTLFGTRTDRSERITAEWSEPDADGIYELAFTAHYDDTLGELDRAWQEAEAALPEGWMLRGVWCRKYRNALKWSATAEPSPRGTGVVGIADSHINALTALAEALRARP